MLSNPLVKINKFLLVFQFILFFILRKNILESDDFNFSYIIILKLVSILNDHILNLFLFLFLLTFKIKNKNYFNNLAFFLIFISFNVKGNKELIGNYLNSFFFVNSLYNSLSIIHPFLVYIMYSMIISQFKKLNINFLINSRIKNIRTTIFSFFSLILGSWWAQQELSWGGWWNWDFVEVILLLFFIKLIINMHNNLYNNYFVYKKWYSFFFCLVLFFFFIRLNIFNSIHSFSVWNFIEKFYVFLIIFIFMVYYTYIEINAFLGINFNIYIYKFYVSRNVKLIYKYYNIFSLFVYTFFTFFFLNLLSLFIFNYDLIDLIFLIKLVLNMLLYYTILNIFRIKKVLNTFFILNICNINYYENYIVLIIIYITYILKIRIYSVHYIFLFLIYIILVSYNLNSYSTLDQLNYSNIYQYIDFNINQLYSAKYNWFIKDLEFNNLLNFFNSNLQLVYDQILMFYISNNIYSCSFYVSILDLKIIFLQPMSIIMMVVSIIILIVLIKNSTLKKQFSKRI